MGLLGDQRSKSGNIVRIPCCPAIRIPISITLRRHYGCGVRRCIVGRVHAAMALLLLGSGFALGQGVGVPRGVNPSNSQDLTYRANPQDLTVPGASNPQDLVRPGPGLPKPISPLPRATTVSPTIPLSSSLGRTFTVQPSKKPHRRKPKAHAD
jgi:hypothetical protein